MADKKVAMPTADPMLRKYGMIGDEGPIRKYGMMGDDAPQVPDYSATISPKKGSYTTPKFCKGGKVIKSWSK